MLDFIEKLHVELCRVSEKQLSEAVCLQVITVRWAVTSQSGVPQASTRMSWASRHARTARSGTSVTTSLSPLFSITTRPARKVSDGCYVY